MSDLDQYPQPIIEGWAAWEMFRKLGFSADDLYWEFRPVLNVDDPGPRLSVVLKQKGAEFRAICSPKQTPEAIALLQALLPNFILQLNQGTWTDEELAPHLQASYAWKHRVQFVMALEAKGFAIPKMLN